MHLLNADFIGKISPQKLETRSRLFAIGLLYIVHKTRTQPWQNLICTFTHCNFFTYKLSQCFLEQQHTATCLLYSICFIFFSQNIHATAHFLCAKMVGAFPAVVFVTIGMTAVTARMRETATLMNV